MRRLNHPINVRTDATGRPVALELGGQNRPVQQVLDRWREAGRWWEGDLPRCFYRVDAGGLFDLSCDELGQWRIETMWD